ncbi:MULTISPECIES: flagellar motor protein MotD [Pseudoxanthomonas]|jgi:chemotaxis protein MotB|uniref:Flagellar motor protein MotD n=1 Tax=Pseudoxanthomonas winnipegensis TaxID=2480810 RepID=A0A4Q9TAH5_9GAMM|nr:flagellar motor protein MotD [Pseudoxanthomonas winnipegensis]RZZ83089.1 flagellar motor protein MotD [Pseudoxanthomonas winnipegensis]RZZ89330.1 flagellar motor protein MotD [Pseudoxanthomonas winnipegensis]TAA10143.1 flagellar motor protein MotD [Pseudoxanthomonas winnipegensis]TAA22476.1 flagellar motor protein MotD [Pseudoxanthomonas winnipegensis]TAA33224.1 flagellar motor protein MotD [Pseudoxanthomonas winnipegensis]
MARKHQHEDHVNHEAWAIPMGDLMTLLLAFFVVMYAISSVNEGKFRAVSDALNAEFGGPPRSVSPVQLGKHQLLGSSFDRPSLATSAARIGPAPASQLMQAKMRQALDAPRYGQSTVGMTPTAFDATASQGPGIGGGQLGAVGENIQAVLSDLVAKHQVTVRRGENYLEVEIQSDILFPSGVATPSPVAASTVQRVAEVLRDVPNAVRVEGYTDDQPIATAQFASNWELSAARAASVVHVLTQTGVSPARLAVVGYGQFQPVADNATAQGRNANRRVVLVILATPNGGRPRGPDSVSPDTLQPQPSTPVAVTPLPANVEAAG